VRLDRPVRLVGTDKLRHLIGGEGVEVDNDQRYPLLGDADNPGDVSLPGACPVDVEQVRGT